MSETTTHTMSPTRFSPTPTHPLRLDLVGPSQLAELARRLAKESPLQARQASPTLLQRFRSNGQRLLDAYRRVAEGMNRGEALTPDAEWLLDNFYIIEDVLQEVETDLPRGYYRELPALGGGPFADLPRVYALAVTLVAHTDSALEELQIRDFVTAYQTIAPLTIGEIWAVPTMLRLALLENLRRLADELLRTRADHADALEHAERIWQSERKVLLPDAPSDAFTVGLLEGLRDHVPSSNRVADILQRWMARYVADSTEVLRREHQRQAANQVSIGNCVTSLRLLTVLDWRGFVEGVSLVEKELRSEPSAIYGRQDFATRDRYRRAVEKLAQGSRRSELEVAQLAVQQARQAREGSPQRHVGWYLVGDGVSDFAKELGSKLRAAEKRRQWLHQHPRLVYFGLLGTLLTLFCALFLYLGGALLGGWWLLALVLVLLPCSEISVALTNYLITRLLPPRVLPRLDFRDGIPAEFATFVVIPTLLTKPEAAVHLAERLELHYLANPDPRLFFALLTDFTDAPTAHMSGDAECVEAALERIRDLNQRYAPDGPERFFLFHRPRHYNPAQGCWMGHERKRGKLQEFNLLLRGGGSDFTVRSGSIEALQRFRFVLSLDTDTVLPRDAARQLVGILAHPLNQPVLSTDGRRVVAGYALLQPRVSFLYRAGFRSWFAAIFAGSAGLDPYASAVSDTYMDLFGSGSYTGKGLYDVDAFEATVGHAFPENSILSHDLIESNFARCGLATDVEVFDEFPARYHAYARREHRWARGDWQLLPWLGRTVPVPGPNGSVTRASNVLPLLERWKIVDNLRRTLVPPALFLFLVMGWTVLPGSALVWTLLGLLVPFWSVVLEIVGFLLQLVGRGNKRTLFKQVRTSFPATLGHALLSTVFLPNQVWILCDAIVRTLYRLIISRRHMLEWETAAAADTRLGEGVVFFLRSMWPALLLTLVASACVLWFAPENLPVAAGLLLLWLASPLVACWVSATRKIGTRVITEDESRAFRQIARQTWLFFERFVTAEDHWLPPDNYQEDPKGVVAHRTSPTNMGLYLLSCLAAHDLGYLTFAELLQRVEQTLGTLAKLPGHRGHFYNWYDTSNCAVLAPAYVSTVDSGNLLACLLTLKQGLLEKQHESLKIATARNGLRDTLAILHTEWQAHPGQGDSGENVRAINARFDALWNLLGERAATTPLPDDPAAWQKTCITLSEQTRDLVEALRSQANEEEGLLHTAQRLSNLTQARLTEVDAFLSQKTNSDSGESGIPALATQAQHLADSADQMAQAMDFHFLYNSQRDLFSIGYNLVAQRLDPSHYDLLASEAALTSFLAVARGVVPRKHWFQLGRPAVFAAGHLGLASWGGTMFEYLLPRLFLPLAPGTLLDQAERTAVLRQIEYGKQIRLPWGISESGFYLLDAGGDYQYQAFGVPGLGLKRGLNRDRVIAPYATLMATMLAPREALANLDRLQAEGGKGPYGFYEAIDYTPGRVAAIPGEGNSAGLVVRSYMAHHQGMSLLSLADVLTGSLMMHRLRKEASVRSAELFLDERVPMDYTLIQPHEHEEEATEKAALPLSPVSRRIVNPMTPAPRTHLLSNGHYTVVVTNAGGGYSVCRGQDVTRWRADRTTDSWGPFFYLRDLDKQEVWSAGFQPTTRQHGSGSTRADLYEVVFSIDKANYHRIESQIDSLLEVTVAPDKNVEVRRLTLHNLDSQPRLLEVTSYVEVVLLPHGADLAHPAFGKLFLETEWVADAHALLCRRRPRDPEQKPVWAVHVLAAEQPLRKDEGGRRKDEKDDRFVHPSALRLHPSEARPPVQWETDRCRFLGRRHTTFDPVAMQPGNQDLSGTTGPVLDPIFSLRQVIRLDPDERVVLAFSTGVADSREEALTLADQFHSLAAVTRAFELAWAHSRVELYHLRLDIEEAHLYQRLAGHLLFPGPALRAPADVLLSNRQGQPGLWRHGISGDLPILLLRLTSTAGGLPLFQQLLRAHTFWRVKGFLVDLVVLFEEASGYYDEQYDQILNHARNSDARDRIDLPGGVFLRKASHMSEGDRNLILTAARVVLDDRNGPLGTQMDVMDPVRAPMPRLKPLRKASVDTLEPSGVATTRETPRREALQFENKLGGFSADGYEYIIAPETPGQSPPNPWINVVANPIAGFLISDSGTGYCWAGNSQTNRLTPWSNDPVSDTAGEAIFLRDEETGVFWSPTPLPCGAVPSPAAAPSGRGGARSESSPGTVVRHGQGYSVFESHAPGLEQELTLFMALEEPVKIGMLRLRNLSGRERHLSLTYYVEWVLGGQREQTAQYVITEKDTETGAILARNPFHPDYGGAVAFAEIGLRPRTITGDRQEFLGRNGRLSSPAALRRTGLSGYVGPALDPCAAFHAPFLLRPGEETVLVFLLGQTDDVAAARRLINRYRQPRDANAALERVVDYWDSTLGTVQVNTPDPALNVLMNRWLLYQVIACRMWARSGFYQSGGAYGFRDQLQDSMALVHALPQQARAHLLRAAGHQFLEGDVQHWWHPPACLSVTHLDEVPGGSGIRTRFSDDFLWLPFAVAHYVNTTGDLAILQEQAPYLEGPQLRPGQDESYGRPTVSNQTGSLYEHCVRALEHGWKLGPHGLPLMGCGDWNDGMNRVGIGGKGESVWVAWFQISCLLQFASLAEQLSPSVAHNGSLNGDSPTTGGTNFHEQAKMWRGRAEQLRVAVETTAYDGKWYRRAYFDDGTPLGSASNDECQIDSLPQTWAVLSGVGDPDRSALAMTEVAQRLILHPERLILLFTPAFDHGVLQPGYIKGYLPGIRENGGQYTHAATWVVQALARLGQGNSAYTAFDLLNPVRLTSSPEAVRRYRLEPYVVAGDVYSHPPHGGRGGWSWYTGSAAWLYRVVLEDLLGFQLSGNRLRMNPCLPSAWSGFKMRFRHGKTNYQLQVECSTTEHRTLDGITVPGEEIVLVDDGQDHEIHIQLGTEQPSEQKTSVGSVIGK